MAGRSRGLVRNLLRPCRRRRTAVLALVGETPELGKPDVDEQSLTIAQAKTKLARTFGVDPSNIKITVEA